MKREALNFLFSARIIKDTDDISVTYIHISKIYAHMFRNSPLYELFCLHRLSEESGIADFLCNKYVTAFASNK